MFAMAIVASMMSIVFIRCPLCCHGDYLVAIAIALCSCHCDYIHDCDCKSKLCLLW